MKLQFSVYDRSPIAAPLLYILNVISSHIPMDVDCQRELDDLKGDCRLSGRVFDVATVWDIQINKINTHGIDVVMHEAHGGGGVRWDVLPLMFYLMNCLQEANRDDRDVYGRYPYTSSWQFRSGTIKDNVVQQLMNIFILSCGGDVANKKSQLFISHDIDYLYGARKEEVAWAASKWRLADLIKLIFLNIVQKPTWRNIDKVLNIESEYEIRSTFFWLVNQGGGKYGIPNADYDLNSESDLVRLVEDGGCYNGLHKSVSDDRIDEELDKSGYQWHVNRNHFLSFQTQEHWKAIAASDIKLDCSLGFAEHYGFRNSYGKPFRPYDFEHQKPYDFVEMPLHIMDATFKHYLKTDADKIGQTVIDFIEKNRQDCVLSLLWHNNYLTEYSYQPYLKAYKQILAYVYESKMASVTPQEILDEYLK